MDVLNDLLRIKVFREKKAERILAVARHHLRNAEQLVLSVKTKLRNFRFESARRERELYAELCSRLVLIRDIDSVQIDVQLMKEREEELVAQLRKAEVLRNEASTQEMLAQRQHIDAVRAREKYYEMSQTVMKEQEYENTRQEELETEESAEVRFLMSTLDDSNDFHIVRNSP